MNSTVEQILVRENLTSSETTNYSFYAYLIGKVMGDGHLDEKYQTSFVSKSRSDLEGLRNMIIKELNIPSEKFKLYFRKAKGESFLLRLNFVKIGKTLFELGAPKGNKTKQASLVPEWIFKSREHSKMFLKAILEDELSTIKILRKNYSNKPRLKLAKSEEKLNNLRDFLNQIKFMLEKEDVQCSEVSKHSYSKQNQTTRELYLDILGNKRNILLFRNKIGFLNSKQKTESLQHCCDILFNTLKEVNPIQIKELRRQGLSLRKIAEKTDLNKSTIARVLKS